MVPLEKTYLFLQRIDDAVDDQAIDTALNDVARPLGLDSIFAGVVPTRITASKEIPDRILLQRFPNAWASRYNQLGYVFRDPVVERLQVERSPFTWNHAYTSSENHADVNLIRGEASEFGLRDGFVVPIVLLDGIVAAVSFGGSQLEISPDDRSLLNFVANYAIGSLIQQRRNSKLARSWVTAREHDCLLWAADGKSDWDISMILGISRSTVTKHMLSARKKLGAVSRTHAIALAIREKLLR